MSNVEILLIIVLVTVACVVFGIGETQDQKENREKQEK